MNKEKNKQPEVARVFRYIFFLRFPILFWIAFGAFGFVDTVATTAVTRVLFTMRNKWQLLYVAFYVVLAGWQTLTSARLICAYGEARFNTPPPRSFVLRKGELNWPTFLLAQVPGLVLLIFIYARSNTELTDNRVSILVRLSFMALGVLFAFAFWYVLAWLYAYLHPSATLGQMQAFLFPTHSSCLGRWLEDAAGRNPGPFTVWLRNRLSRAATFLGPGFVEPTDSETILPGQYFAILMLIGLIGLHFALAFITYPLPRGPFDLVYRYAARVPHVSPGLVSIVLAVFLFVCSTYYLSRKQNRAGRLCLYASLFFLVVWTLIAREPDFPALATIIVLLSAVLSLLAGFAFILDRYRVPAIVPLFVVLLALHLRAHPDHIFYPQKLNTPQVLLKSPQLFVKGRATSRPWIVITATGGGIHAALWTSLVLAHLEELFRANNVPNGSFHDNILLLSSASGGSVAVANWMREYAAGGAFSNTPCTRCGPEKHLPQRFENAAAEPSVEAIAWGLLHYDLYQVLFPFFHNYEDRGWFLEQSLLLNHYSASTDDDSLGVPVLPNGHDLGNASWNQPPTLNEFAFRNGVPAFTLNATATESGERYVLGNYDLPQPKGCVDHASNATVPGPIAPFIPAESFLTAFPGYDLSLMAAARLSATFPYVSPTSRAEVLGGKFKEEHLADGGYYDNDGVASAAEFLWLALGAHAVQSCSAQAKATKGEGHADPGKELPAIWLIQIRDSPLPSPPGPVSPDYVPSPCSLLCELTAPLTTLYHSGHVADPERNQRDLAVLERAVEGHATLKTFVFDYRPPTDPKKTNQTANENREEIKSQEENWTTLNWLLSNADKQNIDRRWAELTDSAKALAQGFASTPSGIGATE
jgi:hypothetical protein